ncbi:hypothetical protein MAM1_0377c10166 [Mucor ambiguus]|uniref:Uncharacterized protein n=1 Tax=Mucor ambiguus TaxID=91626 RepID=A0A0C9N3J0_9FUNG|nr:hypothetical protein MAM1_0377c10166 [Mucor ambiguus]
MIDMTYDPQQITAAPNNNNSNSNNNKTLSETSPIGATGGGDAVNMLLAKLDEGTQTIINLRSILTLKTAELNELLAQLELTNQAITTVESTTTQIEAMLKEFGLSTDNSKESLLINAEASLDSAIKSAASIYPQQLKQSLIRRPSSASTNSGSAMESVETKRLSNARFSTTRIRYKPDNKHILRKLNNLLRDLELDSGKFFSSIGTTDDFEVLQKAYVDLDIAKTISLSAKSNMKRRNILMRSQRRRNNMDEIQQLGDKIREGVSLWMNYTRNTPLLVNGEDIIVILDREDSLLARNLPIPSSRVTHDGKLNTGTGITLTPSTSTHNRTSSIRASLPNDSTVKKSAHSRTSSSVSAADFASNTNIHSPSFASLQTIPIAAAAAAATTSVAAPAAKKLYRQSAGPRLTQVKANIGLPRVRTSSITQQKDQQQQHQKSLASSNAATTPPSGASLKNGFSPSSNSSRQSHIPLPPLHSAAGTSTTPTTPSSASSTISNLTSPDNSKKSLLKPPTQRGPGSTLRLRSMLAKRGQLPPPTAGKPPTK